MPSKQRRGTGTGDPQRWSPQRCSGSSPSRITTTTTSTTSTNLHTVTHALLLTSLTVFLSNLLSSVHGNPLNPFAPSLSLGRNLRHLPCVVRSTGQEGICMYALNCFKANGTHLGVCIDKIFFGSCCHVHDHSLLFQQEITDNSIDQNHSTGSHFQHHFPTIDTNKPPMLTGSILPSTTDLKNVTNFQLVSSSSTTSTTSTTTHRTTTTTQKMSRRNSTATATTTKIELKDEVPSTTEYQEFTTFQYVQSSKNPTLTTVEPSRRTTTKTTTRRTPPRTTTTKPTKTRKPPPPPPSRNNTRKPTVQTTTPKAIITTLPEVQRNTSWSLVTRRPATTTTASTTTTKKPTTTTKKPTTTTSTTVRRTTVINRRPTTTPASESSEETIFTTTSRRPTTPSIVPLTRPTRRRPPTVTTTTEEATTTRAPRPRPRPTAEITTVPATSLDHLLDDLVTTTLQADSTSAETTTSVKTTRYPTTTVKVTQPTTPTPTPTTTAKRTTTTSTTTRRTTTTPSTTTSRRTTTTRPTTTKTTTTTTSTTQEPKTTPSTTTTTTTKKPTTTTTTTTTTSSTTPSTTTTTTTTAPKTTTAAGRITPPADADYPLLETSQTENNLLDLEITAGPGLVTWTSIIDDLPSEKTTTVGQAPAGPTTSNSWILIHTLTPEEVLSGASKDANHSSSPSSVTNTSSSTTQSSPSPPPEPSASLMDLALPTLLPQLLPEAAYIYTIDHDQETNQTASGTAGDELIFHSQLASSSSLPSSTEDTVTTSTATTTTTGSTTVEKVEEPSTTTAGSTASTASSTVSSSSTTEAVSTTSAATSTTEVTSSSTTAEPSTTTTTTVSTTSEQTTTSTSTAATEPSSSSTVTDTTAPTTTSTQFTSSVATQPQTSPSTSTTIASSTSTTVPASSSTSTTTSTTSTTTTTTTTTTEQETSPATSTSSTEILIEILGTTSVAPKEPSSPTVTQEPSTVDPITDSGTTEEGSFEEGSGGDSEEESGEEESSSGESYETTAEPTDPTPILIDPDRFYNSTVAPLTTPSTAPESTTFLTPSTLNLTNSIAEIASMFNITISTAAPPTMPTTTTTASFTTTGMPVRFPDANVTGSTTDGASTTTTVAPDGTTTSAIPSLEGIDYRAVCGKRMFPEPRIVGGTKAAFGRWPWQISLRQWRTSTYLHKCGAALLNENWAITAAHCVDNVPPSDLLLRLGEYDLALEEEPYGYQERRVQIVASHPQFDPRTFEYDLALLRFYEPVVFQPNIIPVCVPDNDENHIGRTAFVTGWGRLYEDGPLPSVLQEVTVPVIENKICETMYRSAGYIEHIPHIFICAGWKKGGYDSCEGDSGGPMVIQRPDKRFLLAGVISWGIGCAEPNQPGVYTRISEFRDWINQILQF